MIDVNKIRKDFPILSRKVNGQNLIYFDNAATSQKPIKVINSISNGSSQHTESTLYTEAEMLNLKLSEDDALQEFQRVSDDIQLKYDKNFLNEMKKMAKDRKLSVERKENLQKTLNLSDNISTQEEELIKLLNDYA